jgi:membrane peptidoglycan carboxypeptidase
VEVMDEIAAYQVHSCLTDALTRGTGAPAYKEYGLAKFPAAGKTGTHNEFKDLWFVGYTSAVTCGVWCGFDQQKMIYDGAFSNRIALPIWVDVMNTAVKDYKPEEIPAPQDVQLVEVCRQTGLRATDACYEKVRDPINGGMKAVRNTARELLRPKSSFDLFCDVHRGGSITADLLALRSGDEMTPNAAPLNPLVANVPPVRMKALTVIGEDPYNSVQPILKAEPVNDDGTSVLRALPVEEETAPRSPIKLAPPPPLKLE